MTVAMAQKVAYLDETSNRRVGSTEWIGSRCHHNDK